MYVIGKVRKKNGDIHERELRRKGHRVDLVDLRLDESLILRYVDDGKLLHTSPVEAYNSDFRESNHLSVQTKNSIYLLDLINE